MVKQLVIAFCISFIGYGQVVHPRIFIYKDVQSTAVIPSGMRISIECKVLRSGVDRKSAQKTANGTYAVAVSADQLEETNPATSFIVLTNAEWMSPAPWGKQFTFAEKPAPLNKSIPATFFRFIVKYEWYDKVGKNQSAIEEINSVIAGSPDFIEKAPGFNFSLMKVGEGDGNPPFKAGFRAVK